MQPPVSHNARAILTNVYISQRLICAVLGTVRLIIKVFYLKQYKEKHKTRLLDAIGGLLFSMHEYGNRQQHAGRSQFKHKEARFLHSEVQYSRSFKNIFFRCLEMKC